jgi:hypothetical protein
MADGRFLVKKAFAGRTLRVRKDQRQDRSEWEMRGIACAIRCNLDERSVSLLSGWTSSFSSAA